MSQNAGGPSGGIRPGISRRKGHLEPDERRKAYEETLKKEKK